MSSDLLQRLGLDFSLPDQDVEEEESFSPISEFGKGISTGVDQLQGIGGGALGVVGDVTGIDSLRDLGIEIYQEQMEQAQETAAKVSSYKDVEDVGGGIEYAAHGLGTLLPHIVTTIAGGGIGAFAAKRIAAKGVSSFMKKQVTNRMAAQKISEKVATQQVLSNVAQLGAASGAFGASAGIGTGSIYGDIFEKTGEMAPGTAVAFGSVVGALDAFPAFRILRKFNLAEDVVDNISKKALPEILKQSGSEGVTEAAQTIVERAAVKTIDENREILGEEGIEELINAGILGALGGGVIGGGAHMMTRERPPSDILETPDSGDALDQMVNKTRDEADNLTSQLDEESSLAGRVETMLGLLAGYGGDEALVQERRDRLKAIDNTLKSAEVLPDLEAEVPRLEQEREQLNREITLINQRGIFRGAGFQEDEIETLEKLNAARQEAATSPENDLQEPTEDQTEDLDTTIENPPGSKAHSPQENTDEALVQERRDRLTIIDNTLKSAETNPDLEAEVPQLEQEREQLNREITLINQRGIFRDAGFQEDEVDTLEKLNAARQEAATSPENEGHFKTQGLDITIENPLGSKRKGTDREGNSWEVEMQHDYGYIKKTRGADDNGSQNKSEIEHLDVFVGPNPDSETVYVVDQVIDGEFDEHKAMVGFDSVDDARAAYQANYAEGWDGLGAITPMPMSEFKEFAYDPERTALPVRTLPTKKVEETVERTRPTLDQVVTTKAQAKEVPGADKFQDTAFESFSLGSKSRETVVEMSPEEFLSLAEPLEGDPSARVDELVQVLESGGQFEDVPFIQFTHDGKGSAQTAGHEGRHRALALQKLGVESFPVRLLSREDGDGQGIRWGSQQDPTSYDYVETKPTTLTSQDGTTETAFPVDFTQAEAVEEVAPVTEEVAPAEGMRDETLDDGWKFVRSFSRGKDGREVVEQRNDTLGRERQIFGDTGRTIPGTVRALTPPQWKQDQLRETAERREAERQSFSDRRNKLQKDQQVKDINHDPNDDIVTSLSKLGGINREIAEAEGFDPEGFRVKRGRKSVFTKFGGLSLDGAVEQLNELGYNLKDQDDLVNRVELSLSGKPQHSTAANFDAQVEEDARAHQEMLEQSEVEKRVVSPLLSSAKITGDEIYTSKGIDYEFERYDDEGVVVTAFDKDGNQVWSGSTTLSAEERVIDVVRAAEEHSRLSEEEFGVPTLEDENTDIKFRRAESEEYEQAVAKGLSMSRPARMERAKQMGFDVSQTWHHGTFETDENGDPIHAFEGYRDKGSQFRPANLGTWFSQSTEVADHFAERAGDYEYAQPQTYPVHLKLRNPKKFETYEDLEAEMDSFSEADPEAFTQSLIDQGYDGIVIEDAFTDVPVQRQDAVIFDTNQVRSVNAAFDPDYEMSGNISARQGEETPATSVSIQLADDMVKTAQENFGGVKISLVESDEDVPASAVGRVPPGTKGYMENNEVVVIARNNADEADVSRTIAHEVVGHHGVRVLFGDKADKFFQEVYESASNRDGIGRIATRYSLDLNNTKDQTVAAEEYIAQLAESQENPGLLRRVVARVREFLRKAGLVWEYTDEDIHAILSRARGAAMRETSVSTNAVEMRLRTGEAADGEIDKDPESGKSRFNKLSAVLTSAPVVGEKIEDLPHTLSGLKLKAKIGLLKAIPRTYLADFARNIPVVGEYIKEAQLMEATKSHLIAAIMPTVTKLEGLSRKGRVALAELQAEATIASIDPSVAMDPTRKGDKEYEAQYRDLQKRLKAMPTIAQELFSEMRDAHKQMYHDMGVAIRERIDALETQQQDTGKKQIGLDAGKLRKLFEMQRLPEPYFPLYRFGDLWVSGVKDAGTATEERVFSRFDTEAQRDEFVASLEADGFELAPDAASAAKGNGVKWGLVGNSAREAMQYASPEVFNQINSATQGITDPQEQQAMQDQLHQIFLMSLPETSMRKHMIHRKNRAGYSLDILRGFGQSMFHGSHQLARLQHMTKLEQLIDQAKKESEAPGPAREDGWSQYTVDELYGRHEWAMNPRSGAIATTLNRLGFLWYLGATPAAAIVNMTQTPMIAFPTLAARFDNKSAFSELQKAMAEQVSMAGRNARTRIGTGTIFLEEKYGYEHMLADRIANPKNLQDKKNAVEELDAYMELLRSGAIDKTQSHDISGIAELGERYSGFNHAWTEKIAAMFHNAEVWNREVTGMAAYRMARAAGQSVEQSIDTAKEMIYLSHFDYTNANRPTFLQNDWTKVMFLFKQHSLNMTYRLGRDVVDTYRSFKSENPGIDPAVLKEARTRLSGILGMTAIFAGASGMPMFDIFAAVMNGLFGDEDDDYNFEAEVRASLAEVWGEDVATAILKGPVSALAGADISARVSLNNLWFRDPMNDMEADEMYAHYTGELLGPTWKIPQSMLRGASLYSKGYDRGLESMLPKAMKDSLKGLRYMQEGVQNYRGDPVLAVEDISETDIVYQLLGFSPTQVSSQYEQSRAIKNAEQHILERRKNLLARYALAARARNPDDMQEALKKIRDYNRANPHYPMTSKTISRSMKQRQKYTMESMDGINLNKNLRYLADQLKFTE